MTKQQLDTVTQAAHYVTRLYSGEMTAQEESEFFSWLNASEKHQQEYQQQLDLWDAATQLETSKSEQISAASKRTPMLAMAASVVLLAGLLLVNMFNITDTNQGVSHFASQVGEVKTLTLADGSAITLNTNSQIQVKLTERGRFVRLVKGEAYFDISHDRKRPFYVSSGARLIEVVGTEFSVYNHGGSVKVAVTEGIVSVTKQPLNNEIEINKQQKSTQNQDAYVLERGANAVFSNNAEVVTLVSEQQINQQLSWRQGLLKFTDETLTTVVEQLNRYRQQPIILQDNNVGQLRISGTFNITATDDIVIGLEKTLPVSVIMADDHTYISLKESQ